MQIILSWFRATEIQLWNAKGSAKMDVLRAQNKESMVIATYESSHVTWFLCHMSFLFIFLDTLAPWGLLTIQLQHSFNPQ